ncbi:MAG: SPOR domain-containing protein [Atribacterota bacterium]|nr:SPOR domain-containing protein [Atribacterota bacterium]
MRRSRRIYKRKTRTNLETLIILVGAIMILSVAFYMAREKSFLPPEEIKISTQDIITEDTLQADDTEQYYLEEQGISTDIFESDKTQVTEQPANIRPREIEEITTETLPEQSNVAEKREVALSPLTENTTQDRPRIEPSQNIPTGSAFTVQVGFFSVEGNARNLASEIEKNGFQTFIVQLNNSFKVQVGAYPTREQAERAAKELENSGYEVWVTQR